MVDVPKRKFWHIIRGRREYQVTVCWLILFLHGILKDSSIDKVAHYMLEQTDCRCIEPGYCLGCASFCDLQVSKKTIAKSEIHIQRYCMLIFFMKFVYFLNVDIASPSVFLFVKFRVHINIWPSFFKSVFGSLFSCVCVIYNFGFDYLFYYSGWRMQWLLVLSQLILLWMDWDILMY